MNTLQVIAYLLCKKNFESAQCASKTRKVKTFEVVAKGRRKICVQCAGIKIVWKSGPSGWIGMSKCTSFIYRHSDQRIHSLNLIRSVTPSQCETWRRK